MNFKLRRGIVNLRLFPTSVGLLALASIALGPMGSDGENDEGEDYNDAGFRISKFAPDAQHYVCRIK
jgi:hypothetical protein